MPRWAVSMDSATPRPRAHRSWRSAMVASQSTASGPEEAQASHASATTCAAAYTERLLGGVLVTSSPAGWRSCSSETERSATGRSTSVMECNRFLDGRCWRAYGGRESRSMLIANLRRSYVSDYKEY